MNTQPTALAIKATNCDKWIIVSHEDAGLAMRHNWGIYGDKLYPRAKIGGRHGVVTPLHQLLMPHKEGLEPDHKNGNPLDNTRGNLRYATKAQNSQNRNKSSSAKTSIYKGVNWRPEPYSCWRAVIKVGAKQRFLGHFDDEVAAARAYDIAAKKYFGEFARLNFPPTPAVEQAA